MNASAPTRRTGAETRAAAERVAVDLFSSQGYETTSMRQIAEELGINKASLYYHFAGKQAIVESMSTARATELDELVEWVRAQPRTADLLGATVLRWVETTSEDKVRGIRFANANPALMRTLAGPRMRGGLTALAELVEGDSSDPIRAQLVRMAFLSINSAVAADPGAQRTDGEIVAAARELALALLDVIRRRHPA